MPFIVHTIALEAVAALRPVLDRLRRLDKSLHQQMRDAAESMVLNIGEAEGSDPGNARARIHTALGSTREVRSGLALAVAFGYVGKEGVEGADARLDRVCAMLYRYLKPR
jgi:four helix bundle protein